VDEIAVVVKRVDASVRRKQVKKESWKNEESKKRYRKVTWRVLVGKSATGSQDH